MQTVALVVVLLVLVGVVVLVELAAAVVPLLIVVSFVPPHERAELAALLAEVDSSKRLRLWPALRLAVRARRRRHRRPAPVCEACRTNRDRRPEEAPLRG